MRYACYVCRDSSHCWVCPAPPHTHHNHLTPLPPTPSTQGALKYEVPIIDVDGLEEGTKNVIRRPRKTQWAEPKHGEVLLTRGVPWRVPVRSAVTITTAVATAVTTVVVATAAAAANAAIAAIAATATVATATATCHHRPSW